MTINLHCFAEENIEKNQIFLADTIIKEQLDIVLLQEVAQTKDAEEITWQIKADNYAYKVIENLREKGQTYYLHYQIGNAAFGTCDEGLAIISKLPFLETEEYIISKSKDYHSWYTRSIVGALVLYNKHLVHVTSCHLGWSDGVEVFEEQFDEIDHRQKKNAISIIGGDFNCTPQSKEYEYIVSKGYYDLPSTFHKRFHLKPTFRGDAHGMKNRIDYIFSKDNLTVENVKIVFDKSRISDHLGVIITITL